MGKNSEILDEKELIQSKKFGTFAGVFIPSILTILGVIMYLRMGWVLGNVGLVGTFLIVTISSSITLLTGLSISSTATNMTVKTGGAYYMISRSFGIESGASIGIPLFFAQALGIAFYIAGFSESIHDLFPLIPMPWIGMTTLFLLTILATFSPSLALKTQVFIFIMIILSILSLIFGKPLPIETSIDLVSKSKESFWIVFAVFFPAVTGILSGVSMSGDLKDPGKSIPIGTISSILVGYMIYLLIPFLLWKLVPNSYLSADNLIMTKVALIPQLIYIGLWGATLSSALGSLLAAPRTLQALAYDKIVPRVLGKGRGITNDPYVAIILTFFIAMIGVMGGSLDIIAPILTMFFLTSYGILNLSAGVESIIGNPSWRPRLRVHWGLSFIGAFACFTVMLFINPVATYIALIFCMLVFFIMKKRKVNARWSDIRRGLILYIVRNYLYKLSNLDESGRNWRPNLLVLSGAPTSRWHLIEIADAISHGKGFLTVCSVVKSTKFTSEKAKGFEKSMRQFLEKKGVPALTKVKISDDIIDGITGLIDDYGIGSIAPNTLVFGETEEEDSFIDFSLLIKIINKAEKNLLIIRHHSTFEGEEETIKNDNENKNKTIDVWWGGISSNAHLMLALSYMLQTGPEWSGATLRVRALVKDEDERQGIIENLNNLKHNSRIGAQIDVYVKKEDVSLMKQIKKYSHDADLIFIGIKAPNPEETADQYSLYYETLIEETKNFPTTILTLAGEKINFEEIFKE